MWGPDDLPGPVHDAGMGGRGTADLLSHFTATQRADSPGLPLVSPPPPPPYVSPRPLPSPPFNQTHQPPSPVCSPLPSSITYAALTEILPDPAYYVCPPSSPRHSALTLHHPCPRHFWDHLGRHCCHSVA